MIKLKIIACDVLNREISYLASMSECIVDVSFIHQGLHRTPEKLKLELQKEIDKANLGFPYDYYGNQPMFDYIVIGYGLCSNGIVGIESKHIPIIIPKAHDCITLLLGSRYRYKQYFDDNPGTFWFSPGWIERGGPPGQKMYELSYHVYFKKYGEEAAKYLVEIEKDLLKDYKTAAYINWGFLKNSDYYMKYTKECADYLGWSYADIEGDSSLLERILSGIFNEDEVLIVPPGKTVVQSFDENIIKAFGKSPK